MWTSAHICNSVLEVRSPSTLWQSCKKNEHSFPSETVTDFAEGMGSKEILQEQTEEMEITDCAECIGMP